MPEGDKLPARKHLQKLARKGDKSALAALKEPKYPAWIQYMREYSRDLHGRSGIGQVGFLPLGYQQMESWCRLKGIELEPYEVDGLLLLDAAMLYPGDE